MVSCLYVFEEYFYICRMRQTEPPGVNLKLQSALKLGTFHLIITTDALVSVNHCPCLPRSPTRF